MKSFIYSIQFDNKDETIDLFALKVSTPHPDSLVQDIHDPRHNGDFQDYLSYLEYVLKADVHTHYPEGDLLYGLYVDGVSDETTRGFIEQATVLFFESRNCEVEVMTKINFDAELLTHDALVEVTREWITL